MIYVVSADLRRDSHVVPSVLRVFPTINVRILGCLRPYNLDRKTTQSAIGFKYIKADLILKTWVIL